MRYELIIALRYLRARRKDAFISITTLFTAVGVTIGVAALVVMLAVMSGFETNLRQRMLSLSPQVQVQSFGGAISNYAAIEDRIDHTPGVAGSDPFIVGQGLISSAHGISGVVVRGVEPRNPVVASQLQRYVDAAALRALESGFPAVGSGGAHPVPGLLLGATLTDKLKVKPGDPVRIVAPIIAGPNAQLSTRSADFRVAAVFASGVQFIDSDVIFMALRTAQDFFGRQGKADGIEVKLHDLDATTAVTNALRSALGHTFRVSNWMEYDQAASAGFAMLKRVYALVLLLLIGVAAFNLVATLIMVVMEKRKDIAVLMSMGATPREVRLIFVLKGLIVGAFGTLAGLMLGAVGCFVLSRYHFIHIQKEIYGMSTLPVAMQPLNFALVAIASMILCLIATFYPARQASRELPVEVFRS
ncbi:MAG TPA: ABC transporter permease [Candidatus Binataceae bacterium]|nr:ABC transporter permease [Candidatus Binataceae bacterium]